jgi:DNA-binding MarR family transcriptional regulator
VPVPTDRRAADALLATSRVMTAVVARTLADVPESITVPQLRLLVMLDSRGAIGPGAVAEGLGVNPSNATRTCDKLVDARLVKRSTDPDDRRRGILELTDRGRALVSSLMGARRLLLDDLVSQMSASAQREMASGLEAFLDVVDRGLDADILGESGGSIISWLR